MLITVPDNGPDIRRQVEDAGLGDHVETVDVADLAEAVQQGYQWARPDGIVLLSPAAPSFGRFRDYHERAAAFTAVMETCRYLTDYQ
jgi:UDP-N-acetylmuramoylalanine--D-glutamate ligase